MNRQSYVDGILREQWSNGTQAGDPAAGYTAWDANGTVTTQRALTTEEAASLAALDTVATQGSNQSALINKAQTAITANGTYIALTNPTAAQTTAQVKMLTRENTAIIKLLLKSLGVDGTLDDTNGT